MRNCLYPGIGARLGMLVLNTAEVEAMDYRKIITIEPGKMGGKPCIRGMRMTVYDVLDYLASGMTEDEILHDFPDLTRDRHSSLPGLRRGS